MLSNTSKNIILNTTHSPSSLKKKKIMMNRTLINNTKSSSVSAKNQKRNSRISANGYNHNKAALLTLSVEDEVLKPVKETFENLKTVEVRLIISLSLSLSLLVFELMSKLFSLMIRTSTSNKF